MGRTLYARQWTEIITAGHSLKVYSEKVTTWLRPEGERRAFSYVPEAEASDQLMICLEDGGQNIVLRSRKSTTALSGISIFNPFPVGEGDRIWAYAKDADEGDALVLNIIGEMIPASEWRNYQE